MDKTKKRSGNQRATTSKGSKTKVDVHKHFDPTLKRTSRGTAIDFPEVVITEESSGRNTPPCIKKRKQQNSPPNYYEIEFVPDKRSGSNDRKTCKVTSSTSSSSSYSFTKKILGVKEENKKKNTENRSPQRIPPKELRSRLNGTTSMSSHTNHLKSRIPTTESSKPTRSLSPPCSPTQAIQRAFILQKDPVVEKIKEEIGLSAKFYNEDVKQTVAELKQEIAKYRKSLNKNVNILNCKVKNSCLEDNKLRESSVQTDSALNRFESVKGFNALVTKIAEFIGGDESTSRQTHTLATASTETDQPIRKNILYFKTHKRRDQSTITDLMFGKVDVAVDQSLDYVNIFSYQTISEEYIKHQKENIYQLDELIKRTRESLNTIKNSKKPDNKNKKISSPNETNVCLDVDHLNFRLIDKNPKLNEKILIESEKLVEDNKFEDRLMKDKYEGNKIEEELIEENKFEDKLIKDKLIKDKLENKSIEDKLIENKSIEDKLLENKNLINTQTYINNFLIDSIGNLVSDAIQRSFLDLINNRTNRPLSPLKGLDEMFNLENEHKTSQKQELQIVQRRNSDVNRCMEGKLRKIAMQISKSLELITSYDNFGNAFR